MASAWSEIIAADGSRCTRCHTEATPSFPVSSNPEAFFQVISEHTLPMLLLFTVDLTSRPGKVITSLFRSRGCRDRYAAQCAASALHRGWRPDHRAHQLLQRDRCPQAANACDPPRLKD